MVNIVDDRVRPKRKKNGSIGSERYEVFITMKDELMKFLSIEALAKVSKLSP